jgi:hypothetical protein
LCWNVELYFAWEKMCEVTIHGTAHFIKKFTYDHTRSIGETQVQMVHLIVIIDDLAVDSMTFITFTM